MRSKGLRKASPPIQLTQLSSRLSLLEAPTPVDRVDISGNLTEFSSTSGALHAVKGTEEGSESHVDFTSTMASPPLQRTQLSIAFISPGTTHAAGSRWYFR